MPSGQPQKRIAILGTRGIPAHYGGFETFAEELSVRLVEKGIDVTVYCGTEKGTAQPANYKNVKLVYLPVTDCGPLTTILFDLRSLWHARKIFDVVYMLGYGVAPFCFIPRVWGSTVWLNVDGIEWARAKWNALARLYFKAMEWFSIRIPDRVIADAEGIKAHLASRHRLSIPCSVIPYGAKLIETPPDKNYLAEWNLVPGDYYLVVCRLEPENHVMEIMKGYVAAESSHPLVVLGDNTTSTPYVQRLLQIADSRIRLIGTVYDQDQLNALRYYAKAYFHGHSVGGTNPSLLEALGCGNAVIAHDNTFNREVAAEAAIYFQSSADIPPLVKLLESDNSECDRMSHAARNIIKSRYTWDLVMNKYLSLLRDL